MSVESHWLHVQAIMAALQAGKGEGKRPRLPTESAALLGTPLESQPSDISLNFGDQNSDTRLLPRQERMAKVD